jgi:gamma-glutamyltranspeptidase / glutathione hydrolase
MSRLALMFNRRGSAAVACWRRAGTALLVFALSLAVTAAEAGQLYAVASAHPLATRAGEEVLVAGGNAFDAAVAVASTLAVVEPFASGFGGGGFFLLHRASDGRDIVVDAREKAPQAATRDMYLDAQGKADTRASLDGARAAAIPGLAAGLVHLQSRYGSRPLAELLLAAHRHAEEGYAADARFVAAAGWREGALKADALAAGAFLDGGKVPTVGFVVRQPALGSTIRAIATAGRDGFYRGPVAQAMVAAVAAGGGIWTLDDLARYDVVEREPQRIDYGTARIVTAPLPSSGGLVMAQVFHILACYDLRGLSPTDRVHLVVEAMRRGYHDRSRYMGDADFVTIPATLARREYAVARAASIDVARATPSAALDAAEPVRQGDNTTHFSVVDAEGNRVAATLSVNGPFGAAFVAGTSGVLLNNEMNDFSVAASGGNLYGLTGFSGNIIEPGKRPLSSMSPTFVEDARGVLVLGTPGGSRIISMVIIGILEHLASSEVDPERVVAAPRYHHQYLPDRIEFEPGQFAPPWVKALEGKGHVVIEGRRRWGNMQAVFVDAVTGEATPASDPRGRTGVLF